MTLQKSDRCTHFREAGQITFFPLNCCYCGTTREGQSFKYARVLFNLHNLLTNMLRGSLKEIKSKKKFCLPTVNVNVSGKHFYMDWFTVFDLVWQRYMMRDREANTDQPIWRNIAAMRKQYPSDSPKLTGELALLCPGQSCLDNKPRGQSVMILRWCCFSILNQYLELKHTSITTQYEAYTNVGQSIQLPWQRLPDLSSLCNQTRAQLYSSLPVKQWKGFWF